MLEDRLSPAETSEENQQFVQYLQRIHNTRTTDIQTRARIRERLLKNNADAIPRLDHTVEPASAVKARPQHAGETNMQILHLLYEKKTRQQRLSLIAAAVLVAALVGSLALLLRFQTNVGSGAGVFDLRPGWTEVASYSGTGSKTISGQDIELPTVWGMSSTCSGSGPLDIRITGPGQMEGMGADSCQSISATRVAPQSISFTASPIKLQTIKVTANASMVWHLQIAQEVRPPTFKLGSGWVTNIGMGGGNGSNGGAIRGDVNVTNPAGQTITPKTWGVVLVCIGEGHDYIQFTPSVGRINMPPCDGQPRLAVVRYRVATGVQEVHAFVSSDIVWSAQLVACIDERQCGNTPAINISPTP